ncbi:MAG: hypothetical protein JXK05_05300 [Campylobacterales bacterium]|nr:hypothetical protein [Campylobacterales bacterium]
MQSTTVSEVVRLTKLNESDQAAMLRYFGKLPASLREQIMARHRVIFHQIKQSGEQLANETLSHVALLLAIKSYYAQQQRLSSKQFSEMSLEEIRNLSVLKLEKFKAARRKIGKRERLIHLWSVVKLCKEQGLSFREISIYLRNHHRFEVSHSLIFAMWGKLEQQGMGEQR